MHNLQTASTDLLRVVTGSAADLDCIVSFVEATQASPPVMDWPETQFTNISTATTTTILGAPNASSIRKIKGVSIVNTHATTATTVRVIIERTGPVNWDVFNTINLLAGESLTFTEGLGWFYNKATYSQSVYNQATAAQGAGFSSDTYVTNSNLLVSGRLKVGSRFQWRIHMSKTAASTATPQGIIRFGTAGAIGDTARVTFTGWPAQTAAVDEAVLLIEATVRTSGSSGIVQGNSGIQHSAAVAAGFGEMFDAITSGTFDMTVAGLQAGISLNGSTSAAWTITQMQAQAENLVG